MSKWNSFEVDMLDLIFKNVNPADFNIAAGSSVAGNLHIALFTGDPLEDQTGVAGNECTYTGYARKAVARSAAGWTRSVNVMSNTSAITFVVCSGGSNTATHYGICTGSTPAQTDLLFHGQLSAPLVITSGVTPQIPAGSITITED